MINKRLINTGAEAAAFDPLQNFETVTYTGNGSTQKITGYIRKGAAFNGSSSKIVLPTSTFSPSVFTLSAWCNVTSDTAENTILELVDNQTYPNHTTIVFSAGSTTSSSRFLLRNHTTNQYNYNPSGSVTKGVWKHYAMTYDGSTVKSYIDGSLVDSGSLTLSNTVGTISSIQLGFSSGVRYLNGKLDQVRIFNKALSQQEVTTLYGETYSSSTKSTTDIFNDGSGVALYELDDDANDTGITGTAIDAGQSAVFNGIDAKVTIATDYNIGDIGQNWSTSVWAKTNQTTYQTIYGARQSNNHSVQIKNDSINVGFYLAASGSDSQTATNGTVWNNIIVTHNGSTTTAKIYLNGSLASTWNTSGTQGTSISDMYLASVTGTQYYNLDIDDVRFYSDILTDAEAAYIADNDTGNIPTGNLVAHFKLDGNADNEVGTNAVASNVTYSDPAAVGQTQYNGTPTNVNFLGMAFQPDLVWIKSRNSTDFNLLFDSVRGYNFLSSNTSSAEDTSNAVTLSSYDTNGFTTGNDNGSINGVGDNYVAWCWKAADTNTTISAGTVGNTIASDVRANTAAGFSIVKYTKSGTTGTIAHGLDEAPLLILEKRTDGAAYWNVRVEGVTANNQTIYLNQTTEVSTHPSLNLWTTPTTSVFGYDSANAAAGDYIAYCFHSVDGYQKIGSYPGSISAVSVATGFQPRFVLVKNSTSVGNWTLWDDIRGGSVFLQPNNSGSEASGRTLTFNSDGFTINTDAGVNGNSNGDTFIYLAIA